jgi:hypothetical protein
MEHTIEGKKFCITGKLEHYTRTTAQRAILDAGGEIAKTVGPKTDFLVVGSGAVSTRTKARSLNIPVIEEANLGSFLAGEVVEVDEEIVVSGEASVRGLIGEARAALDGRPGSGTWSRIIELVDSCAPDQLDAFVDFLEPQLASWAPSPTQRWTPRRGSVAVEGAPEEWIKAIPSGELRVAPYHWLVEMLARRDAPKHRLVRAVHLSGLKVTGSDAAALLSCEDLTNLRWLDLGESKLSSTFWKKLRTLPSTEGLERLRFTALDGKSVAGMRGPHHLSALRELSFLAQEKYRDGGVLRSMLETELAQSAPRLTVIGSSVEDLVASLEEVATPNLEELGVMAYSNPHVRQVLASAAARRIGRVRVGYNMWFYRFDGDVDVELSSLILGRLEAWTSGGVEGPAHLDLSDLSIDDSFNPRHSVKLSRSALADAVVQWTLPTGTTSMSFGRWFSTDLKRRLAERGVAASR